MSFRYMRVLVLFDLPSVTNIEKREYRQFRKLLLRTGFIMLQESVYCKLVLNTTAAKAVSNSIRKNKPPKGLVQMLIITEKQYSKMEYIIGSSTSDVIDSSERLIII